MRVLLRYSSQEETTILLIKMDISGKAQRDVAIQTQTTAHPQNKQKSYWH